MDCTGGVFGGGGVWSYEGGTAEFTGIFSGADDTGAAAGRGGTAVAAERFLSPAGSDLCGGVGGAADLACGGMANGKRFDARAEYSAGKRIAEHERIH